MMISGENFADELSFWHGVIKKVTVAAKKCLKITFRHRQCVQMVQVTPYVSGLDVKNICFA